MSRTGDIRRRNFLLRALGLPFLRRLQGQNPSAGGEFHLHPHYRAETPLDALRLKVDAKLDDFPTEEAHDQIAAILAQWRAALLESPRNIRTIEKVLALDFQGASPRPAESRIVRPGPALEFAASRSRPAPPSGRNLFIGSCSPLWLVTRRS